MRTRQCNICGGRDFAASEYRHSREGEPVPALECADCRALVLDETVAISEEQRTSIRRAKAVRAGLAASAAGGGPEVDERGATRARAATLRLTLRRSPPTP
jgi:hypothetical protein